MNFKTPVLLMLFNRPEKIKGLYNILEQVKPNKIYISSDGPRTNNLSDKKKIKLVREIFENPSWDCEVHKLYSSVNLGCWGNCIASINWFFKHEEEGIILEEDCMPSKSFFTYCNELLAKYRHEEKIMHINGFDFFNNDEKKNNYYFSKLVHVWGWATWRRAWKNFVSKIDSKIDQSRVNFINKYYEDRQISSWMLNYYLKAYLQEDEAWDTLWAYSIMIKDGICISPSLNLVHNIGFDETSAYHFLEKSSQYSRFNSNEYDQIVHPPEIKHNLIKDQEAFKIIKKIDPRASSVFKILDFFNFYGIKKKIKKIFN